MDPKPDRSVWYKLNENATLSFKDEASKKTLIEGGHAEGE